MSQLLSVFEGANELNVKPATIRAWILQERIPFLRLGGRVFLRRSDVDSLIAGQISVKPAPVRKVARTRKTRRESKGGEIAPLSAH